MVQTSLVIHGGAGSITRAGLPPSSPSYAEYVSSLRRVLAAVYPLLLSGSTALHAATFAVSLLEDDPLFNAGKGSVFTRDGRNELEASVMLTRGSSKRGVGVQLLTRVKNPIFLARELLLRNEDQDDGAARHNSISGPEAEKLADLWGVEMVDPGYFWTKKRWEQHKRGLRKPSTREEELEEYLPQGTVGCVALDAYGTLCVTTSTGGLTNKIPGRIGDTPTLGAGFWAEEWEVPETQQISPSILRAGDGAGSWWQEFFSGCLPQVVAGREHEHEREHTEKTPLLDSPKNLRAVALSGTGNGDYFLRLAASHSIAARCRFGGMSLRGAAEEVVGPGGEMQRAAGHRWGQGDGEGGIIGLDEKGTVVMSMNCGGMFRGYIDKDGQPRVGVFSDEGET